jgi:hypothetical protein
VHSGHTIGLMLELVGLHVLLLESLLDFELLLPHSSNLGLHGAMFTPTRS